MTHLNPKLARLERAKEAAYEKVATLEPGTTEGDRAFHAAMSASGAVCRLRKRLVREERKERRVRRLIGRTFVWEPKSPHARCVVTVEETRWNGEEWWVRSVDKHTGNPAWNSLDRFIEATMPTEPKGGES